MANVADVDRCRRDLYAISIALLSFNLAGGSVASDATTIFGSIHIARSWVLVAGAWIAWAYFLWRFLLASENAVAAFRANVYEELKRSDHFIAFTRRRLSALEDDLVAAHAKLDRAAFIEQQQEREKLGRQINDVRLRKTERMTFSVPEGNDSVSARLSRFADRVLTTPKGGLVTLDHVDKSHWQVAESAVPFTAALHLRIVLQSSLRATWRRSGFSDSALPLMVALLAPIVFMARVGWHVFH